MESVDNFYNQSGYKELEKLKQPPSSVDAERSVIGGLLLDNDAWDKIADLLIERDFYRKEHRVIFKEITKLASKEEPFDVITLSEALFESQLLDQAGGLNYLAELAKNTPTAQNITAYAKIVKERAKLRALLNTATDIADLVYDQSGRKSDEIIDEAERKIFSLAESHVASEAGPESVQNVLPDVVDRLDSLMDAKDGITGTAMGLKDLDQMTSGLHAANLVIVAGRPSMGKTLLSMNIAENVARTQDKPVLVFSMEMPAEDLVTRMISSLGRVDQSLLRSGKLSDEHWARIASAMKVISEDMKMLIDDSPALSPAEVRSRARRVAREHGGLSLIIVDYLQLMRVPGMEGNRTQEVSEISRSLKALAKELSVPVIAISQLNRSVDDRSDKRPMMSDLRESGAIEQDADVIMFVFREEVYQKDKPELKGIGEIIIGKQRNGPIGIVKLTFTGQFLRFSDYAPEEQVTGGF
ncbi:replicative DNA helicase [Thiotrichales bacterium 19S9-12]|nr:replicative DNA helicase [Thiotrichales bacterium 19S9-11]MCF6811900.1 replicative DNA helicase [Thiotrichales bacterium 19S9-12]